MKLILSHNQSMKFNDFFESIQGNEGLFDYSGYSDLIFLFDYSLLHPAQFINLDSNRRSLNYDGAYITGYLKEPDLAIAVAEIFESEKTPFVDRELADSVSLSKVSESARLVINGIPVPKTYAGTKLAIIRALTADVIKLDFPLVMKLADGERGRENFTIFDKNEVFDLLREKDDASVWILQKLVKTTGFYRINLYSGKIAFGIFRSLDGLPEDRERHLAHMYKPAGGENAVFLEPKKIPHEVKRVAKRASKILNRQFVGVDVVVDKYSKKAYVLEANYNPQLVTVESFQERRIKEFLRAMKGIK